MNVEDSLYPLPPRELPDSRVVASSELKLTVEYFGFVQVSAFNHILKVAEIKIVFYTI